MALTNADVAHLWAYQLRDSAYSSSKNFYFSGRTIYSYGSHFPIATFVTNERGEQTILFTEDKYSNTTAKHIHEVRSACSHLPKIYVPELDYYSTHGTPNHEHYFTTWIEKTEELKSKLGRAKYPVDYYNQIRMVITNANSYADFFGIDMPERLTQTLVNIDLAALNQKQIKSIQQREERKKKQQELAELKAQEKLTEWLSGKNIPYIGYNLHFQKLRIKNNRIETTKGVQIPIELAKRFYESLKNGLISTGNKILHYRVDSIAGNEVRIGCHKFELDYLLNFGASL